MTPTPRAPCRKTRAAPSSFVDVPILIIAAVNGPAVGWGATLATLCDIVLISEGLYRRAAHQHRPGGGRRHHHFVADLHQLAERQGTDLDRRPQRAGAGGGVRPRESRGRARKADGQGTRTSGELQKQPAQALREIKKIITATSVNVSQHLDPTLGPQRAATLSEEHHTRSLRRSSRTRSATDRRRVAYAPSRQGRSWGLRRCRAP